MDDFHVHFRSTKAFFSGGDVHKEPKEWGEEHWIVNKEYCGKKLMLKKDRRCSMHTHKEKDEVFYIQSGKVKLETGGEEFVLEPGDFIHIPPRTPHRFTGIEDSEIFEFSTNHQEDDSYRTEYSGHVDVERFGRQTEIVNSFKGRSILVVGDCMLDRYTQGSIDRISPEAPVPVVRAREVKEMLGGAGNAVANIKELGANVQIISVVGKDGPGQQIKTLLKDKGIKSTLLSESTRPTTVKHRIVSANMQQIVRIDTEESHPISSGTEKRLIMAMKEVAPSARAILLTDYAKGVLTSKVISTGYSLGKKNGIPVILDPKPNGIASLEDLKDASVVTPNMREARLLLGDYDSEPEKIGCKLSSDIRGTLVLTRGGDGMDVYKKGKLIIHFDSHSPDVVDVSGAGDTVAAVVTLCMACGSTVEDAADIGNRAASIVVRKSGAATLTVGELIDVL
ncbi:cupin domain-containing protein [Patescibacteria group bacterium]|nr:cupin domain-containing protein [Patescibacteria group bacterium]MBU1123626.1 cupin domain-containing protein [Patescibacteria group bacterium]MBU1911680.1 cupin domain-containing protein [Patescibacteria group bacterium]